MGIPLTEFLYKHLEPVIGRNVSGVLGSISINNEGSVDESSDDSNIEYSNQGMKGD